MKKLCLLILLALLVTACTSQPKMDPERCSFDNDPKSLSAISCGGEVLTTSSGVQFSLVSNCLATKADDCPTISFTKLSITGSCSEVIDLSGYPAKVNVCSSGLSQGQRVELNMKLTYLYNGQETTTNGLIIAKLR